MDRKRSDDDGDDAKGICDGGCIGATPHQEGCNVPRGDRPWDTTCKERKGTRHHGNTKPPVPTVLTNKVGRSKGGAIPWGWRMNANAHAVRIIARPRVANAEAHIHKIGGP